MRKIGVEFLLMLFVMASVIVGCRKNDAQLLGIVATEEVVNNYGTIVEVSYSDDTKMYFRLLSDKTAEVVNYHRFYLDLTEGTPWVYRGDICIPEKFVHDGKTYTVTCIGKEAFAEAGGWDSYYDHISLVSSVVMPNSIDTIRDKSFKECKNMTAITIPNSVVYIGEEAFWGAGLDSITLPPSVAFLGKSALSFTKLTSIMIPQSILRIAPFTFYGCKDLVSVTFHDQLESIGDYAFAESGFSRFEIPSSLTSIGLHIIENTKVTTLVCHPSVPPVLNTAFTTPYIGICESLETIYVPEESVEAYKGALQWQRYKDMIVGM